MLAERIDQWNQELSQKARQEGILEGRREGILEGRQEGEVRALLRLLERKFGSLNPEVQSRIAAADPDLLLDWIDRAATAASLAEVFTAEPAS